MKWIAADRHPDDSCHCDPGAKPGVACPERRRREPAFKIAPRARLFIVLLSFLSLAFFPLAAQTPQALLDAGQVDQVMQMLEQQIRSAPTPETYNLLCRAYLELENWDAGIHACEAVHSSARRRPLSPLAGPHLRRQKRPLRLSERRRAGREGSIRVRTRG